MTKEEQARLYEEYNPKVSGYIFSKTNNYHEVEDLSSDVFLKVFSNLEKYNESRASLSTWIYTITKNTVTDFLRANRQNLKLEEDLCDDNDFVIQICQKESLDELAMDLKTLPNIERNVLLMHFYQEKSIKMIAEQMNYSTSYIKAIKKKALQHLKEKMVD